MIASSCASPAVSAVREARWPPAETPPIAMRSGSSPYWVAFARSHRTAAFASWAGAGYLTDGTRR
jgi:hypothetical protein